MTFLFPPDDIAGRRALSTRFLDCGSLEIRSWYLPSELEYTSSSLSFDRSIFCYTSFLNHHVSSSQLVKFRYETARMCRPAIIDPASTFFLAFRPIPRHSCCGSARNVHHLNLDEKRQRYGHIRHSVRLFGISCHQCQWA
jgi:hypothetical protein